MRMACTSRLLLGDNAGDPADKKHLLGLVDNILSTSIYKPFHGFHSCKPCSLLSGEPASGWSMRSRLKEKRLLVILRELYVKLLGSLCLTVGDV